MQSARHLRTLEIGRRLDGRPFTIPGPGRLPHCLIGGETGSGKSGVTASIGAELARCDDVAIVGIDLKLMELALWRPRLTCLANTADEASMLLALTVAEMCRRNELLKAHGLRMWEPRFGPWIVVVVDELARLAGVAVEHLLRQAHASTEIDAKTGAPKKLDRDLVRTAKDALAVRMALIDWIAAVGRAAGITLVTATQYPTAEVIDPSIRSQLGLRFMLRVISREQVGVVLGAGNEQHITPDSIPVSQRGGFWCVGNPGDPRAVRGRAFLFNDTTLANRFRTTSNLRIDQAEVFKADPAPHLEAMHPPTEPELHEPPITISPTAPAEQQTTTDPVSKDPHQGQPAMTDSHRQSGGPPPLYVVPADTSPDPYPDRSDRLGGVRQHNQPAAESHRNAAASTGRRPRHPFTASNLTTTAAVVVMFSVVLSATATSVLVLYADHPRQRLIAAGVVVAVLAWTVLLALPALVRGPRLHATAPVGAHEDGNDQADTNPSTPVRRWTEPTAIDHDGGRA